MAAITTYGAKENWKPGHRVYRGIGSMNSTDASGTLSIPKGQVIGFRAHSIGSTTVEAFGLTDTPGITAPGAGIVSPAQDGTTKAWYLTVARSSNGSGLNFFFEVEYASQ